ncbi:hypothetical protein PRIPAC_82512 [Pristionchus pacificus]|uniref:BTB And C-terminal Kelch domain containing protein n=1 Tax=Pristionchus pacificus TaxID=54126 RepID=A0A2A6CBL3_PRIPA|nr:hypothetical protein PRIPAC_82512 [Pristionchus pacificus]|eukprot:PDM75506.1 BTB And C-terminal Kelch domain containing protein [Pristionchus pacificus]
MKTASFLCMEEIVDECYKFMRERIEYEDALPLLFFSRSIDYNKNDEYLMKFIASNFVLISHTPEFLDLTFGDILNFVQRDFLNIDDEKQVFNAVDRWITNQQENKDKWNKYGKTDIGMWLLYHMRCPCLSPSFITETVLKKKWITDSPRCMDVINIGIHKLSEMWKNKLMFRELAKIHLSLSRILRLETVMSAISLSSRSIAPVEFTELWMVKCWTKLSNMLRCRDNSAASCTLNGKLYDDHSWDGECYDPATNEWTRISSMIKPSCNSEAAALNGSIYLVGGKERGTPTANLQRYTPATNKWIGRMQ